MKAQNYTKVIELMRKYEPIEAKLEKLKFFECTKIEMVNDNNTASIVIDEEVLQGMVGSFKEIVVNYFEKELERIETELKPL